MWELSINPRNVSIFFQICQLSSPNGIFAWPWTSRRPSKNIGNRAIDSRAQKEKTTTVGGGSPFSVLESRRARQESHILLILQFFFSKKLGSTCVLIVRRDEGRRRVGISWQGACLNKLLSSSYIIIKIYRFFGTVTEMKRSGFGLLVTTLPSRFIL